MAEIDYPNPKVFVNCSRGKYRSRTFPELARAIARQWSAWVISQSSAPFPPCATRHDRYEYPHGDFTIIEL